MWSFVLLPVKLVFFKFDFNFHLCIMIPIRHLFPPFALHSVALELVSLFSSKSHLYTFFLEVNFLFWFDRLSLVAIVMFAER